MRAIIEKVSSMGRSQSIGPRILSATLLASGLMVVWLVFCGWLATLYSALWGGSSVHEQVQIYADGTPIIHTQSGRNWLHTSSRTLDGEEWSVRGATWLQQARIQPRAKPPGLFRTPLGWGRRVTSAGDGGRPPSSW